MLTLATLAAVTTWTLVLGGDIMLNGIAPSPRVWQDIAPVVRQASVAIANLEIPLTTSRKATARKTLEEIRRRDQFILKADPSHAQHLAAAGWDLVSLGNNHAMDYGAEGLDEMLALMRRYGFGYAGAGRNQAIASRPVVFTRADGGKVAMVSAMAYLTAGALHKTTPATPQASGVHALHFGGRIDEAARETLRAWIGAAKAAAPFVVVGLHWGIERQPVPTSYQVALGRACIEAGADLVWGHHPHVLQGAELFKGKPILYSTGNLISPLPSQTALFRITYRDDEPTALEILPANIRAGRVLLVRGSGATAAARRFMGLCEQLRRRFPHRDSELPRFSLPDSRSDASRRSSGT